MAEEFCEEYASSLKDLTFNSKPHISMLTMLAEENVQYAPQIVKVIEAHLQKVKPEAKLPTLYLIDSIMKNVGQVYQSLFTQNIVSNFCGVFEKVDEKVRAQMYKLRQTWADIFPNKKLYAIDVRVKEMDPAWPILAQPPPQSSIHVNPRFLKPPPEEVNAIKKSQEIQEEEMRQQLLAKQQELLKLQRQKLELELLQTQVLVEEQKRQLILKEQQLRGQQSTTPDMQKSLALQQLTNVAAFAAAAAASQGLSGNLDQQKAKQGKGIQQPGNQVVNNKDQPFSSVSTGHVELSQSVIPNVMVNNKTIDINKLSKTGFPSVAAVSQSQFMPNTVAQTPHMVATASVTTTVSHVKSVSTTLNAGKANLSSAGVSAVTPMQNLKQANSNKSNDPSNESGRLQSKVVSPKISPKKGTDKSNKDNQKNKDTSKKQTPSPKKTKSKQVGKSTNSKGNIVNTDRHDRKDSKEIGSKTSMREKEKRSRSKSGSISPIRNKTDNFSRNQGRKSDHWQSQRDRRSASHSRSRSPGKLEKNRDREDRTLKRGRRSPRREKENDGTMSEKRSKTLESSRDVDLRAPSTSAIDQSSKTMKREIRGDAVDGLALATSKQVEEPPYKKTKTGDAELDEIFSGKDQDYRQLDGPVPKLSPIADHHGGWAQYKASRPDEFKSALRARDNDQQDVFGFGKQDQDLRTTGLMRGDRGPFWNRDPRSPGVGGRDPRILRNERRNSLASRFSHANEHRFFSRPVLYQATRESDPNIPRALMFDRGAEIMKQADHQLRSGQLTIDQHREIMEQLAKLYELQRMRHIQREQRMRESLARCSPEPMEVITISPDSSPVREETDVREKTDDVLAGVTVSDSDKKLPVDSSANVLSNAEDMSATYTEGQKEQINDEKQNVIPKSSEASKEVPESNDATPVLLEMKESRRKPNNAGDMVENVQEHKSTARCEEMISKSIEMKACIGEPEGSSNRSLQFPTASAPSTSSVQPRGFGKNMPIHTVMIDDVPREVRFFDDVAIVLLDNNDPREIAFRGPPQEIIIGKQVVRLGFQDKSKEFEIDGHRHSIKFGAPTREVIIDNTPYSAVFGGPPIVVTLNGKRYDVRLCGPTPEVYFGDHPRFDLLPQIMEMRGRSEESGREMINTPLLKDRESSSVGSSGRMGSPLRWVTSTIGRDYEPRDWRHSNRDGSAPFPRNSGRDDRREDWRHSRFNDDAFRHDRGRFRDDRRPHNRGNFRDFEHWDRQESQWDDFRPGSRGPLPPLQGDRGPNGRRGSPQNDFYDREARSSPYRDSPEPRQGFYQDNRFPQGHPSLGMQGMPPMNAPHRFEGPNGPMPGMTTGGPHPLPAHSGMSNQGLRYGAPFGFPCGPPSSHGPRFPPQAQPQDFPYPPQHPQHMLPGVPPRFHPPMPIPQPTINVNELFEKLVATGIIPQVANNSEKKDVEEEDDETTKDSQPDESKIQAEKMPVIELNPESLKIKYAVVTSLLYCGIQCSSCGVRFTAEQTDKYAQHLDWHFRQNRREKDSARKALSRKWYYDVQDWVQFEEIEDLEERDRSFFEIQAHEKQTEVGEDVQLSVPAGENEEDKCCVVCHELFELYWNEEHEEWHFKDSVRHEEKNYHPLCYEDFKEQQLKENSADSKLNDESNENTEALDKNENKPTSTKIEQCNNNSVESLQQQMSDVTVTEPLPNEKEPVDTVDGEQPPSSDFVSENRSLEPMLEEQHETLEVFNVLSSSYTVPPLIGMEYEESPVDSANDQTIETLNASTSDVPVMQDPEAQSKTVNITDSMSVPNDGTVTVDKMVLAVNEPVEQDESVLLSDMHEKEPEESDENEVVGGVIEMDISSFTEVVPETSDKESAKEAVDNNFTASETQIPTVLDSVKDANLTDTTVTVDEVVCGTTSEIPIMPDTNVDTLLISTVDVTVVTSTNVEMDEDVTLKESSDIISEFAFEQPVNSPLEVNQTPGEPAIPCDTIEQKNGELAPAEEIEVNELGVNKAMESNISEPLEPIPTELINSELTESNPSDLNPSTSIELNQCTVDEENNKDDNSLKTETDGRFTVLPPVNRGTELSGLCSIM